MLNQKSGQYSHCEQNVCQKWVLLTKSMPGIGYVEPYQVASIVIMSKTYARKRFC